MYVLAQRNRKFIEARSINYQRRTFRDRNREARSISTRKFSMIRETRIVEKGSTNRRLKNDTRRLFLFHRTTSSFARRCGREEIVPRVAACVPRAGWRGGRSEENGRGPWYATLDSDTGATLLGERYEPR